MCVCKFNNMIISRTRSPKTTWEQVCECWCGSQRGQRHKTQSLSSGIANKENPWVSEPSWSMPSPLVAGLMESIEAIHHHVNQFREEKKSALSKIDSGFFVPKWVFVNRAEKERKGDDFGIERWDCGAWFLKHGYSYRREKPISFSSRKTQKPAYRGRRAGSSWSPRSHCRRQPARWRQTYFRCLPCRSLREWTASPASSGGHGYLRAQRERRGMEGESTGEK